MEKIKIQTLIDITNSNVIRNIPGKEKELNQYKNWTTLLQCVGLRCNITYDKDPTLEEIDIKSLGFGSKFKGKHKVWSFVFEPDRDHSYIEDNDPVALLRADFDKVPIFQNLDETINIPKATFDSFDPAQKNIIVQMID